MRHSPGECLARVWITLIASLLGLATTVSAQIASSAIVPNTLDGTVSIIDVGSGTVVSTPHVGLSPTSVAVTPDGRRAYVTAGGDLVMINMNDGTVTTVVSGVGALGVAATPDGRTVYFGNFGTGTLTPLDVATNTLGTPIPVGTNPLAIAITPDGLHACVVLIASMMAVVDLTTGTVVHTIPLSTFPSHRIVFSPDSQTAYVGALGSGVLVVDLVTNTEVLPAISIGSSSNPQSLAITADGSTLYTANSATGNVSVINTATKTLITTVAKPGPSDLEGIALTPDESTAYVVDVSGRRVMRLDTATNTFIASDIAIGGGVFVLGSFMSPRYIVNSGGALGFADEAQLFAALRSTSFADFKGGTLQVGIDWTSDRTFSFLTAGGTIDTTATHTATLTKAMVGEGTLIKKGTGTLVLANTLTTSHAGTRIDEGTLQVDGHHTAPLALNGGTLSGTGTVDTVSTMAGGAIQPGHATTPGILTVNSLTPVSPVTLKVRLNGAAPGSYDVLKSIGPMALNMISLLPTLGYTPGPADSFTIATNTTGAFVGHPEGQTFTLGATLMHITYAGGASGHDAVLAIDKPPTITALQSREVQVNEAIPPIPFAIDDDFTDPSALTISTASSNQTLVPLSNIVVTGSGRTRALNVTLAPNLTGQAIITVAVSDQHQTSSATLTLTVVGRTYYLAEGATGKFFSTDILIANPNPIIVPVTVTFFKADGSTVVTGYQLQPTSRATLPVATVPGMKSTAFSTTVNSPNGAPLAVERTMWWDASGYGSHGEKASAGPASQWYFAEGAQGYFHTYFLVLNPNPTANVAHVTYFLEDGAPLTKDYALAPTSRTTIDIATEPDLQNRSFGALVKFDTPGMAERAMYFGDAPLYSGGHDSSGATAPSLSWALAEGATGSFFDTFILVANPGDLPANVTMTYLPASGLAVTKTHLLAAHQRLTINIATEDPTLASTAVGTSVSSDQPVIVERSQYWPHGNWYEAHNSVGETAPDTKWALAEGRVGGPNHAQTYILLANAGAQTAQVTVMFLREEGGPVTKTFTVAPTSRVNVAVNGPGGDVPELADENFGTSIVSTQPIIVERSMYTDANGVIWAAGTNATAARMP